MAFLYFSAFSCPQVLEPGRLCKGIRRSRWPGQKCQNGNIFCNQKTSKREKHLSRWPFDSYNTMQWESMIGNIVWLFPIFWNSWDLGASIADADISTGFRVCVSGWNCWGNVIKKLHGEKREKTLSKKWRQPTLLFPLPLLLQHFGSFGHCLQYQDGGQQLQQNSASQLHITWHYNKISH